MSDAGTLETWTPRYQAWTKESMALFQEGKAKEAFASYPFLQTEGAPFVRLSKPASETRFGLITTGGYSVEGVHEPFSGRPEFDDTPPRFNVIGLDADPSTLRIHHPGYDHRFAKEDHNANLPFDRLTEMVREGELGSVSNDSIVLMGLVPNVAPLINETIPAIVRKFKSDSVEGALLVPS